MRFIETIMEEMGIDNPISAIQAGMAIGLVCIAVKMAMWG